MNIGKAGEQAFAHKLRGSKYQVEDLTSNSDYFDKDIDFLVINPETGNRRAYEVKSDSRITNEFYKSGCQLSEIAAALKQMELTKTKLFVDSSEPRSIQFFRNEGINAVASTKGKSSVKAGLMFLQDNLLIVSPSCKNFINELKNFSYIKSKQTGEWTDDTTHEWSHAIDACRYGYSDIYTNKKLKSFSKTSLGL